MRKIFLFIIFISVALFSEAKLPEQSVVRIGYIDKAEYINSMEEIGKIEDDLVKLKAEYESEYQIMLSNYNEKVKSYLENNKDMTEPLRLARQAEITECESRMNLYRKRYMADIDAKRKVAYEPIILKVDAAIKQVAENLKLTIIFDQATPVYVSADCVNILPDVIKILK